MKKGEILTNLEILDIASNGKAIGKVDGQVVFVSGLVPGDVADVQVTKKRRKYAEARTLELRVKSDIRTEPKCSHFGICGGCKWQHMTYERQLAYKSNHVAENLKKISHVHLPEMNKIIPSDKQYHYRNKLEYTFSNKRWLTEEEVATGSEFAQRNALGFHIPGLFDKVVDLNECFLQEKISDDIRSFIRDESEKMNIPYFDLREQRGILRNLIVRTTSTGEVMVILAITKRTNETTELLNKIKDKFPEITSLQYVVNRKKNDTIFDLEVTLFSGQEFITEIMHGLDFKIGPKSFYQTNSEQVEKLYSVALEMSDLTGNEVVYDLYTGTGTIANFVASRSKKVIGVEYVPDAVEDAKENSRLNGISNTHFVSGDMKDILGAEFFSKHGAPDLIITDPPRAGMHLDVVKCINESGAKKVVYVSCNSASQARDLEILDEKYKVVEIQPVDMFPQTAHVENVVKLELK